MNDRKNSEFSLSGDIFQYHGAKMQTLKHAPDEHNIRNANIYIIVDRDTKAVKNKTNYMIAIKNHQK